MLTEEQLQKLEEKLTIRYILYVLSNLTNIQTQEEAIKIFERGVADTMQSTKENDVLFDFKKKGPLPFDLTKRTFHKGYRQSKSIKGPLHNAWGEEFVQDINPVDQLILYSAFFAASTLLQTSYAKQNSEDVDCSEFSHVTKLATVLPSKIMSLIQPKTVDEAKKQLSVLLLSPAANDHIEENKKLQIYAPFATKNKWSNENAKPVPMQLAINVDTKRHKIYLPRNIEYSPQNTALAANAREIIVSDNTKKLQRALNIEETLAKSVLEAVNYCTLITPENFFSQSLCEKLSSMGISSIKFKTILAREIRKEGEEIRQVYRIKGLLFSGKEGIIHEIADIDLTCHFAFNHEQVRFEFIPVLEYQGSSEGKALIEALVADDLIDIEKHLKPLTPYCLNNEQVAHLIILYIYSPQQFNDREIVAPEISTFLADLNTHLQHQKIDLVSFSQCLNRPGFTSFLKKNADLSNFLESKAQVLKKLFDDKEEINTKVHNASLTGLLDFMKQDKKLISFNHEVVRHISLLNQSTVNHYFVKIYYLAMINSLGDNKLKTSFADIYGKTYPNPQEPISSKEDLNAPLYQFLSAIVAMRQKITEVNESDRAVINRLANDLVDLSNNYFLDKDPSNDKFEKFKNSALALLEDTAEKELSHDGYNVFSWIIRNLCCFLKKWVPVGDWNKTKEATDTIKDVREKLQFMLFESEPKSTEQVLEKAIKIPTHS